MTLLIILPFTVAFIVSRTLTVYLCSANSKLSPLDIPNERSLHAHPTPRSGGVAILAGLSSGFLVLCFINYLSNIPLLTHTKIIWIVTLTVIIGMVSFWDDRKNLPISLRLTAQLSIIIILLIATHLRITDVSAPHIGTLSLGFMQLPVTILVLFWAVNLFNFMDGMDGLAGSMAISGCLFLAIITFLASQVFLPMVMLIAICAVAGFLPSNWTPAKIFMGDAGSISLGFFVGSVSLLGFNEDVYDIWVPVLIFSPFIVDATFTLVARILRREKFWLAHRQHYYQRLVLLGWGNKKTLIAEYVLILFFGLMAILYSFTGDHFRIISLIICGATYLFLILQVRRLEHSTSREQK